MKPIIPSKNVENINILLEDANDRVRSSITYYVSIFSSLKWKHVSFIIPMKPKPSQRPRLSWHRVYVPGALRNGKFFDEEVLPKLNGLFISTPCKVTLDVYMETPAYFTKTQKCLAEMRVLRPWRSSGDIDNFEKAVYDMIQPNARRGHTGVLSDDILIIESHTNKYYSITPRYEIYVSYLDKIPETISRIFRLD